MSEETLVSPIADLDLFTYPQTQKSIERDILSEHRPVSVIDSKSPIEFNFSTPENVYPRLTKTRLRLRLRISIEKPMKVAIVEDDWKHVSLNKNFGGFLFKHVDFTIGDRIITPTHQTYGYTSDIENRLGRSKVFKETYMGNCLWYEGDHTDPESLLPIFTPIISGEKDDWGKGKEFEVLLPIHLAMFQQPKALIGGCNMRLRFIPNDPTVFIKMGNSIRLKSFDITDACLFMHYSQINQDIVNAQHLFLAENIPVKYPIREAFTVPITIPANTQDYIIDQLHNGQLPNRAFLTMVKHTAFNGSHNLSANNYQHFNLNFAAFYLNGIQYPEIAYTPNFKAGLYAREYNSIFETTDSDFIDTSITINKKDYPNGYFILGVNFNPDLNTGYAGSGYLNPVKKGSLRLHLKFAEPLRETITVLVYMDFDATLEINNSKNAIVTLV